MTSPWLPAAPVEASRFAQIRRRTVFECCKWDPQVEDVSVLADLPLLLRRASWRELASLAEALDRETLAAEAELRRCPALHRTLALPRRMRTALAQRGAWRDWPRVNRYDFHFTTEGWRISEVNSDVPGGFIEASGFTSLIADEFAAFEPCGDPAAALVETIIAVADARLPVALVHATAYSDDRQVMVYLSKRLASAGCAAVLAAPDHIEWRDGHACVADQPLGAIMRFFPGEWLPNLARRSNWPLMVHGSRTPVINPASAMLTQSKRFPLTWDRLRTPLATWRELLPETRALTLRDRRRLDPAWVYKPALGRIGDGVGIAGATAPRSWRDIRKGTRWHPRHWIAQRRFDAVPMTSRRGDMFPSIGVFVIAGRACGVYGRMSPQPLIDHRALDVAVLVEREPAHDRAAGRLAQQRLKEFAHADA